MLDAHLRRLLERPLARAGRWVAARATANQVTWVGFACGIAAAVLVAADWAPVGLAFFALNRIADALDGAVAYERGPTAFGGFLDSALDLIVYLALGFAFAIRAPESILASLFFVGAFAVLMTTELSLRYFARPTRFAAAPARSPKVALESTLSDGASSAESKKIVEDILTELDAAVKRGEQLKLSSFGTFQVRQKARRLPPPLIGHTETSFVLAIACAYPPVFPTLAYIFGALCFFACGMRIVTAMDHLKDVEP